MESKKEIEEAESNSRETENEIKVPEDKEAFEKLV